MGEEIDIFREKGYFQSSLEFFLSQCIGNYSARVVYFGDEKNPVGTCPTVKEN